MPLARRTFLGVSLAASAGLVASRALAEDKFGLTRNWEGKPPIVMPDPAWEIHDQAFKGRLGNAFVERLWSGGLWTEGPVWMADWRCLLFSDIPNARVMRWSADDGHVGIYDDQSHNANGHTRDREGRLVSCEHDTRRVTRREHDGSVTVLLDRFDGKPLNAPNDVVVGADGALWFTDPGYGILGAYEGHKAEFELPTNVYRIDPQGKATVAVGDFGRPNGLAFAPDGKRLYISDTAGGGNPGKPNHVRAFSVKDDGTLGGGEVLIDAKDQGVIDGFRVDSDGNLWCSWAGNAEQNSVRVFTANGQPLATLHLPETVSNVEFGGLKRNRLFITGGGSLYATYVNAQPARLW